MEQDFVKRTRVWSLLVGPTDTFGMRLPTRRSLVKGLLLMANTMAKSTPSALAVEETRFPFLDQSLIEFILSIPATQLLRPGERRSLMRRSMVGCVPEDVLARRTKATGARTPRVALETRRKELWAAFDSP